MGFENSLIDGDAGVSRIDSEEIPLQLDVPMDFERTLFFRADSLNTRSGRADPATAANFAKLGTTLPTDPAIVPGRLDQNYRGHVVGMGIQTDQYRVDLGTTVGNFPVNDWVGGLQWFTNLGDGSLRLELARRMVNGSVLSTTGAIDPLTGESWGGARRNGVSAVYYEAFNPTFDFVGIARANLITGKNIPDNTEFNLQGILGKTVFQRQGHEVEIGASLFLWTFEKNLRFYTFGQGGYYSPQAFGSLSFPITWTGNMNGWSWQAQARIGASESREDDTDLYPLNPELAAAAAAQGNPTVQIGGPGGGTSTGLRLALEKQVTTNLVAGGYFEIDRSEGYNPDRMQVYLKYSFGDFFELSVPPEGISPYSRF
nr:cellulose synthase subunit BcsC-related outer membrane protein [Limnobacter parvus]